MKLNNVLWGLGFVVLCFVLLISLGCYKVERSEPMIEDGTVVQTIFRPYHVHTSVVPVTHMDANGNTSVTLRTDTDTYYEQHWIVFSCKHGQFAIDREDIWRKVNPGMRVKIKFVQRDHYKEKGGDKTLHHTDFEFIDCWPADGEWGG